MNQIIDQYRENISNDVYKKYKENISYVIEFMLWTIRDFLHNEPTVTSRIKEEPSLTNKVSNKNKYTSIDQITDIIGFRIVAYFQDDVDKIKSRLADVLAIDYINSTDKRNHTGNAFGYASLHLIASGYRIPYGSAFDATKLHDLSTYKPIKFEIQIRTILEHTWAEIEHDLGYKHGLPGGLSPSIKREFARLAALLEVADAGFVRLRDNISAYKRAVNDTSDKEDYSGIPIVLDDKDPRKIFSFLISSPLVNRIQHTIAQLLNQHISSKPTGLDLFHASRFRALLLKYDINTLQEYHDFLAKNENNIIELAIATGLTPVGQISPTVSRHLYEEKYFPNQFLHYYVSLYIIAIKSNDNAEIANNIRAFADDNPEKLIGPVTLFASKRRS